MPIHHATLAKADKLGVVLTTLPNSDIIQAHWTERNKKGFVANAGQAPGLVDDMKTLRMLVLEYPQLSAKQPGVKKDAYGWTISLRGDVIGEAPRLADAWDAAFEVLTGGEEGEDAEDGEDIVNGEDTMNEALEEEEGDEGKSVVKKKYKTAYRPFHMTCGDELSQLISAHVKVTEDGQTRIDRDKLEKFAKKNQVWDPKYKMMNSGFMRMNVANRLRGKIRRDKWEVVW